MHQYVPNSVLKIIQSPDGHDGFLLEFRQVNEACLSFLRETLPDVYAAAPPADDAANGTEEPDHHAEEALKKRATAVGEAWDSHEDEVHNKSVDLLKW